MVLEELAFPRFEQLFNWQLEQDGQPQQLAAAEGAVRSPGAPADLSDDAKSWVEEPLTRAWLELEPSLSEIGLAPYFFFSRDRLSPAAPAARLSPGLQELVGRLCTDVGPRRKTAVVEFQSISPEEQRGVYAAILERVLADPGAPVADSAIEIAAAVGELLPALLDLLRHLPVSKVPPPLVLKIRLALKGDPELEGLFARWEGGPRPLKVAVEKARGA